MQALRRTLPGGLPALFGQAASRAGGPQLVLSHRHGHRPTAAEATGSAVIPAGAGTSYGGVRFAAVKAQGAYRLKNKKTLAKKLGAKRIGDQYVLPGTIIYKQRGTHWYAGENAFMGRDHTVHAAVAGYVKYYRDAELHPHRQFIGVTYTREEQLPRPSQAPRQRKLGMLAVPRKTVAVPEPLSRSGIPYRVVRKPGLVEVGAVEAGAEADPNDIMKPSDVVTAAVKTAETEAAAAAVTPVSRATLNARRWNAYVRAKRENRVLYLNKKNYSYQESNVQIGRLMGKHKGKTPGTQRLGSRHAVLRHRRKRRDEQIHQRRELERQQQSLGASAAGRAKPSASASARRQRSAAGGAGSPSSDATGGKKKSKADKKAEKKRANA